MKKSSRFLLSVIVILSMVSCASEKAVDSPVVDNPPEIAATVNGQAVEYFVGLNSWNGSQYDRMDTLQSVMEEGSGIEVEYIKLGGTIDIEFKDNPPASVKLYDKVINKDGTGKYADHVTEELQPEFSDGKLSCDFAAHPAAFLSSNSEDYEDGNIYRGFILRCEWDNGNVCEYGFAVRTDARLIETSSQSETAESSSYGQMSDAYSSNTPSSGEAVPTSSPQSSDSAPASAASEADAASSELPLPTGSQSEVLSQQTSATVIDILPVSMTLDHPAFSIDDSKTQDLILAYLDAMEPCEPDPHTGGVLFELNITRTGAVERYSLLGAESDAGDSYVVEGTQWYIADYALWQTVVAYYPKFDFENHPPIYNLYLSYRTSSVNRGRGLSYYDDSSLVWSQEEQKVAGTILSYIDGTVASSVSADEDGEKIEITVHGQDIDKKYLCYSETDSRGYCIVQYLGERPGLTPGSIPGEYTGGGWFVAAADFFEYLKSNV